MLAIPAIALAQEQLLGGKFRAGDEVVVPAGEEVSGDLYASGRIVRIDGSIEGDLVASGGQVSVTGDVGGDVIAGAGTVTISGRVEGDVRAGAGQVTVDGSIGEDLLAGAGLLTISSSGEIGEDLVFGTGRTILDGRVAGDVLGSTGSYARGGSVGGTERVTVSREEAERPPSAGDRVLDGIRRFIALFAVGAALLWLASWSVEGPAATVRRRPWASLGLGILGIAALVVAVIAIVLAMVLLLLLFGLLGLGDLAALTVFTAIAALLGLFFLAYLTFAFLTQLIVGLVLGRLALGMSTVRRWGALALGVLVVVVLTSLPVVSGWLGFLTVVLGLGGIVIGLNSLRRRRDEEATVPSV